MGIAGDLLQVGVIQSPNDILGNQFRRVVLHHEARLASFYYLWRPACTGSTC
jgi:hypothetical protein